VNVLLTGGASGLGASITQLLATRRDTFIYITYSRSEDAARKFEHIYPNVKATHCDFANVNSVQVLVSLISSWNIDILINNAAGPLKLEHFHKADLNDFRQSFLRDVLPTLQITQEALRGFRKKKFGKVITILSSSLASGPPIGWSSYVAGKAYLMAMNKSWAIENAKFNIACNCISPTLMRTGLTSTLDERLVEQVMKNSPGGRLATTQSVAESVLALVTAAQDINGENQILNTQAG
jgi:3-oxoacyl-[acyl-carrier protein] reductase